MEATARIPLNASRLPTLRRIEPEAAGAWLLAFVPTLYLALSGGGYDIVARSQVAIVLWWLILLGTLATVLPRRRIPVAGWIAAALLAGFLALTWVAVGWTQSDERTLIEAGRVSAYLGVLILALSLITGRNARWLIGGLGCAIAVVSVMAVLSKLIPSWYPTDTAQHLYATPRLRYPFDYADGVGEFAALGLPLLLFSATSARSLWTRALAAGALPAVVLCLAMTVSRGGILAAGVGMIFFFALVPGSPQRLLTGLVTAAGSTVLLVALLRRAALRDQLFGVAPAGQRHSMLVALVLVCAGVGIVQAGLSLVGRRPRPGWLVLSRRGTPVISGLVVGAVVIAAGVLVATGEVSHLWRQFKQPNPPAVHTQYLRLLSIAGSHRYQYWQVAAKAFDAHPWKGTGPGTFEFYWAQHQRLGEFVRNAHSLWMETLAELGIPGVALIGGFFLFTLLAGIVRSLGPSEPVRLVVATATAGVAAFCAAAAFDWVWQIGAVPIVAMMLVAVVVAASWEEEPGADARPAPRLRPWWPSRIVLALLAVPALWAIARPLATTQEVRASQSAARTGDLRAALSDALTAQKLEPDAATPRLQRALLLEQLGDVGGAAIAILEAEAREPTNWRIWLVASRIDTEQNNPRAALADYRRARSLNPTSPIFRG